MDGVEIERKREGQQRKQQEQQQKIKKMKTTADEDGEVPNLTFWNGLVKSKNKQCTYTQN